MNEEHFPFEDVPPPPGGAEHGAPPGPATSSPQSRPGSAALPQTITGPNNVLAEVEKSRAMQEVQAALIIAQRFPRDEVRAEHALMQAGERFGLAEKAFYTFPRGKEKVTGPTIRLAEEMARAWGNCRYGFQELEKGNGKSVVRAFCWDVQTNTMAERTFTVEHKLQLQGGKVKHLTDPRDQYEMVANQAQRRVRACILEIIPSDIVEKLVLKCRDTLARGPKNVPFKERVTKMVMAFHAEHGVPQDAIERYLGHKLEAMSRDELVDLVGVYNAIRDGKPREDFFELAGPKGGGAEGGAAQVLTELMTEEKKT